MNEAIAKQQERVARLEAEADRLRKNHEALSDRGLPSVRRHRNSAVDREMAAARASYGAAGLLEFERRKLAAMEQDAADRATLDLTQLVPGCIVRDDIGLHRVVRVSAKSVTVETPWTWTERIPLAKITKIYPAM